MKKEEDISPTGAVQVEFLHSNNPTSPPNLGGRRGSSAKSGVQRMRGLAKGIHDLSNRANDTIFYPTLAFHLLPPRARHIGLHLLKQFNSYTSPLVKEVGWLREEVYKGVQAGRRQKREVTGDPNGDNKTLKLLSQLFQKTDISYITAPDLKELPDAAATIGFNSSFSLLESFFVLHLRLKPLFVGVQDQDKTGKHLGARLNIGGLNEEGGDGDIDKQIRESLARVMAKLREAAIPLRDLTLRQIHHPSTTVEVSPATRFLGALTWDVWEADDLAFFIDRLQEAEKIETHRLKGAVSNQQKQTPRRSQAELAMEQARKRRCPKGLTLVEWQRSFDSLSAIREEISYYTWLLQAMRQKGRIAVIVPSLEGVGFACSKRALYAFWNSLRQELAFNNGMGGVNSLWTKDCDNSQGRIVDGSWLLSQWGHSLDSVALAGLSQPLAPHQALDSFREAVERSNNGFYEHLQEAIERFVEDLLLSQCTLHASIDNLAEQVADLGAGATHLTALESNLGEELADSERQSQEMLTNTRSTLHNRLRRLGVNEASIALVQSSDIVFSALSDKLSNRELDSAAPEAVSIAARLKELHTFWINEAGEIIKLGPTKSSKGGGTWKKQFLSYISNGSAKFVTYSIGEFCLSRRRR